MKNTNKNEEAWVFDGVFPTSLPFDALQSDLSTADSIQLTVNFSYDGYPMRTSEGAGEVCLNFYKALGHNSLFDTFQNYCDGIPQTDTSGKTAPSPSGNTNSFLGKASIGDGSGT